MKRLNEYILNCIEESILSSNNAGSQTLYNKTIKRDGYFCSILLIASIASEYKDPMRAFDSKKVDSLLKKLPKTFKTDIPYKFNENTQSSNKILVKILCLLLACKDEKECEKLITSILSDSSLKNGVQLNRVNFIEDHSSNSITVSIGLTTGKNQSTSIRYTFRSNSYSYFTKKISF